MRKIMSVLISVMLLLFSGCQNNNPQSKYNLTNTDMEIVNSIYEQRVKWEIKQDEKTAEFTSEPFNVYYLNMLFDEDRTLFVPFYIYTSGASTGATARQLATAYYVDSSNNLVEMPDYDVNIRSYFNNSSVAQRGYSYRSDDDHKLDTLANLYSDYKKITEQ